MSRENVEVVRRMYEAFHGADADGALACFDPEVEVDFSARGDAAIGHGRDSLSKIIGSWVGTFEDWSEEIEEIRDLGSQVCVIATQRGRGKGSGINVEQRYALLYEVRGGKIARLVGYPSPEAALEAAGLSE